jgi:ribosomal protein S18 acetylase RimI-like enzyme
MKIKTLENIGITELTRVYNRGFSDYVIKFNADESYLTERWAGGRVQLDYSVGGWRNGELSGLLMSGIDVWNGKKTAFNVATCVAPDARGNAFTRKAYDFLLPKFKRIGIENMRLEVIQINERAVKIYEKVGFSIDRELFCLTGTPVFGQLIDSQGLIVEKSKGFDFEKYAHFIEFQPSWEHNSSAINLKWEAHECFTLSKNETLLVYVILAKKDGRVKQFYINPNERHKGYEDFLFSKINEEYAQLLVVNVDGNDEDSMNFYQKIGLKRSFSQFEMTMDI